MSNPNEVPSPQEPGAQPQPGNVPPAGYQPPQGYPAPQGYEAPATQPGYGAASQVPYGVPAGARDNAPPAGLGYAAPPRNAFGLDFNNLSERLKDTTGVPQQLKISYWLWVAAAALGIVLGVINVALMAGQFGGLFVGAAVTGLIIGLVLSAFYVFCAIRLKEGARWARIVLSVLGGLALIGLFSQMLVGNVGFIGSAAAIAAAILMWLPESQRHFQ